MAEYGRPSTKAEATHLGSVFRRTLESFRPDLYPVMIKSKKKKTVDAALEEAIETEPLEEPGTPGVQEAKEASAGSFNDHLDRTSEEIDLETATTSPRSPRLPVDCSPANKCIPYEEAVGLQNGFAVPSSGFT